MMSPRSLPSSPTVLLLAMRVGVGGACEKAERLANDWLAAGGMAASTPAVEVVAVSASPGAGSGAAAVGGGWRGFRRTER